MKTTYIKNGYKLIYGAIAILLTIFLWESMYIYELPIKTITIFIFWQCVAVLIPGMAVTCIMQQELPLISRLCFAYAIGYAFNILEYFLIELLDRKISYNVLAIAVLIGSLLVLIKERKVLVQSFDLMKKDRRQMTLVWILVAMFVFSVLCYAMSYKDVLNMYHDLAWWCNNTVALKIKFVPDNLFMKGTTLSYHYFSSIQIAYMSLLTGIDVISLSLPLYVVSQTVIMVGSADYLLRIFKVSDRQHICGLLLILFTTGWEAKSIVTYFHHIISCPFGFDIGFAFGIYFVALLYMQWVEDRFNLVLFFVTILIWGVAVGAKAPIAVVLLFFAGVICFYWLCERKLGLSIIYGTSILGIFLIISVFCVGMLSVAGGDSGSYYLSLHTYNDLCLFDGKQYPMIIAVLLRWYCLNPILFVLFWMSVVYYSIFIKQAKIDKKSCVWGVCAGLAYIFGVVLWRIVLADGNSEMYYAMAASIPLFSMLFLIGKYAQKPNKNIIRKIGEGCVIFSFCLGLYFFMFNTYGETGAIKMAKSNLLNYQSIKQTDSSQIDGLQWIRDNTELDALVVSDNAVITGNERMYMYGIISERQQYLEGVHMLRFGGQEIKDEISKRKQLVIGLYNNDEEAIIKLRNEGVDYIIQTKSITPEFKGNGNYLELVKETEEMKIYRMK